MANAARLRAWVPREHGFWVMLMAALTAALARHPASIAAWLTALLVLVAGSVGGASLGRTIRRAEVAQIASAALLAAAGVPVELAAGGSFRAAAGIGLIWACIFVPGALVVRAAFARAARKPRRALGLELSGVLISAAAAGVSAALGALPEALATGTSALTCSAIVLARPTVKHMKPVGLTLAAVSAFAAVVLVIGP